VTEQTRDGEIRVGLIGYGLAGRAFHAPLIATTPGMRLAAVVTADAERARQVAADHPGTVVVESAERLWERAGEMDLVVIATPNRTHAPLARQALAAGLAVVIDKPFAVTADEGRALIEDARRAGLLLTVFQNRRWDGDFLTVRRLLAAGALGDVHRFESRFERWRPTPKASWREQGDPAEAGGTLYDLGSHLIDQALVLFGSVTHVYAELDRRRPGVEVDDDAFVALTHASGVRSHLWMSAFAADDRGRMRVLGSRAAYVKQGLDVQEAALRNGWGPGNEPGWGEEPEAAWGRLGSGESWTAVATERGAYPEFYARVAASLRDGAPPPVNPADAVAALDIIHAAQQSAAEGAVVRIGAG
jgi:scyllo-inositol 2-dehydrogenase (NADP+)